MGAKSQPSGRITLADVAREAGVSVQTASHVLAENLTVRLPETTRQRVRDAALKVGYRPNRLAQAMKRGKTNMIAIWMPLDRATLVYLRMLKELSAKAKGSGYDLMITGLDERSALNPDGKLPDQWPVDGIISIDSGKAIETYRRDASSLSTPVVVLGYEQVKNGDAVAWKVDGAAEQCVSALIRSGRKRIVHLTMDWVYAGFPNERRRLGYSRAMTAAGLEQEYIQSSGETSSAAERAMSEYLETHPTPDAVFGFTDPLAVGAARAILNRGLRIPEDVAIVGYGDLPESEDFKVPISSIGMPIEQIISQAWTWLLERIENPSLEERRVELDMIWTPRESTGDLR